MKYKLEKEWVGNDDFEPSERNIKRIEKQFYKKIQEKAVPFFKWIWNNYLNKQQKEAIFLGYYYRDSDYYNFIGKNKETNMNKILSKLSYSIINEKDAILFKRQWIINKVLD